MESVNRVGVNVNGLCARFVTSRTIFESQAVVVVAVVVVIAVVGVVVAIVGVVVAIVAVVVVTPLDGLVRRL